LIYRIEISNQAEKQLKKLPKEKSRRIISALERCRIRPHNHVERLVGSPHFKLRVGDYRVILGIYEDVLVILVISVAHRRNVYKRVK